MDTHSSTRYHSAAVRRFIDNAQSSSHGVSTGIDLSEEALIAEARRQTGLACFGDENFLIPMKVLLDSVRREARLNAFGEAVVKMHTVRALKNRLWTHAYLEAHPEIRERKIVAPIFIIGPHRSGTTRLHRMLANDDRLQHLKAWEAINPAPRPGQPDLGKASRYEEARKMLDGREQFYPGVCGAHPMHADWPEEEMHLLNQSFCGFLPVGLYNIPTYYRWLIDADKTFAYRHMADLMRLISATRGDPEEKRWVLKNPQHMLDLDVLVSVFPDAQLVFTHRDPVKTVGSVLSLMWHYAVQHTDLPCRADVRERWLNFCEQMARRCMRERANIAASRQMDIYYHDVSRDWRAAMRRVYRFIGLPFTPEAESTMSEWLQESENHHHHDAHRYALDDFGLSESDVDERMMFVRERYGIPYESAKGS
jgi:hypothetical protein